ncbi:MAG: tRNA (cytidine(34)-2'-O)-methyltransferase [Gemmatimonadetes bacterium]|nr:tRNA (cytidine(34)-2'-O)-methyltransferase [Gemmatimonadota bacterium]
MHIALIEPRIPPNTGNIARLCVATDSPLHLIEPLGFSLDDAAVKRAGIDYWEEVDLWVHPNWFRFRDAIARERCLYFSANAERDLAEAPFAANSVLVFGNETDGLPDKILEKHPERCFRIPMPGQVRSLNLANAVSVVLYEGLRRLGQTNAEPLVFAEAGGDIEVEPEDLQPADVDARNRSRMPAPHAPRGPRGGGGAGGEAGGGRGAGRRPSRGRSRGRGGRR